MNDIPLILASASPRRHEILTMAGIEHDIIPASDESADVSLPPAERALALAKSKAQQVASQHPNRVVLGADTMVVLGDIVLGKPKSSKQAVEMVLSLQNREHEVMTGVWFIRTDSNGNAVKQAGFTDITRVKFLPFDREYAENYVATGECMDKAGAYAIQGYGMRLVEWIRGDFYTVMGLPAGKLIRFYDEFMSE